MLQIQIQMQSLLDEIGIALTRQTINKLHATPQPVKLDILVHVHDAIRGRLLIKVEPEWVRLQNGLYLTQHILEYGQATT